MSDALDPAVVLEALQASLDAVTEAEETLGRLDAAAGDGDHGRGMVRGFRAAVAAAQEAEQPEPSALRQAGLAFSDAAGGASGMLYGTIHRNAGRLPRGGFRRRSVTRERISAVARGGYPRSAAPSPATRRSSMPWPRSSSASAHSPRRVGDSPNAGRTSVDAAEEGAAGTAALVARRGRAARLGERSRGTADPGATSLALVLAAIGDVVADRCVTA